MKVAIALLLSAAVLGAAGQNEDPSLQPFQEAIGGIKAPAVVNTGGDRPFQVIGNSNFDNLQSAITRSCDIQGNKCQNLFNNLPNNNKNGIKQGDCNSQADRCRAGDNSKANESSTKGNVQPAVAPAEAPGGGNVQTFKEVVGGVTAPVVTQTGGDRPFEVKGNTFVNKNAAVTRSCDIFFNDCQNVFNSQQNGAQGLKQGDCQAAADRCRAAANGTPVPNPAAPATQPEVPAEPAVPATQPKVPAEPAVPETQPEVPAEPAVPETQPEVPAEPKCETPAGTPVGGELPSQPSTTSQVKCPIVFEGRVPINTNLVDFDTPNDLFDPNNVKGNDLKFSELLEFPEIPGSKFDGADFKPLEVTINDQSIFNDQTGFRRAGLLFKDNSGKAGDPGIVGVKTIHWSVKQDAAKAFNLTHEYLTVSLEAADFSKTQFTFLAGTLLAGVPEGGKDNKPDTWKLLDVENKEVFSTPMSPDDWQNFAVTLDFDKNTMQVFSSNGDEPLAPTSDPVPNDNSGAGQFQIGILKKPTDTADVVKSGFQEANILEGLQYGGIFVEDSANDCVSL